MESLKKDYDDKYKYRNFFGYKEWLYYAYIKNLLAFSSIIKGSSFLDVGCGQGFFSYLLNKQGMRVTGIDLSGQGIKMAKIEYGSCGIYFLAGDVFNTMFPEKYDCIFIRSFSSYNSTSFNIDTSITDRLMKLLKINGIFIFLYNTNFSTSKVSQYWRLHSMNDLRMHFSKYPFAISFFSLRIETLILKKFSFNPFVTKVNMFLSKHVGIGGDLICIVK